MILQRYTFGSKSQQRLTGASFSFSCLWYCKDIHLEANHNTGIWIDDENYVVYDIAKIYIWKQITTREGETMDDLCCLWYCKDIHLEANHNYPEGSSGVYSVVYDIAKIYIWKQITTQFQVVLKRLLLFMILQRYTFGSKSQRINIDKKVLLVVYDIAKIYIWKQITTWRVFAFSKALLFMILQRYTFGSKSQPSPCAKSIICSCLWYCKDIHLEANHNDLP